MALPLPNLDTRRWADLVEEGRALLPREAPGWTDHNIHDPGITFLELFAWIVEQGIYRLNQIPERHRRKFLALIGFAPHAPVASRTLLAFSPTSGTAPFAIPAGAYFDGASGEGRIAFRTLRDLTVAPVEPAAVLIGEPDGAMRDATGEWKEGLAFAPFGPRPHPGASLYLGFTEIPSGVPVSLAFRLGGDRHGHHERERLLAERAAVCAECRPIVPDISCPPDAPPPPPLPERVLEHHSVCLVWEVSNGPHTWHRLDAIRGPEAPGLGEVRDDTRALSLDGIVELNAPLAFASVVIAPRAAALRYLRVRLDSGAYDRAPMLRSFDSNGVNAEQVTPMQQTFAIAAGVIAQGPPPAPGARTPMRFTLDDGGFIQALDFNPAPDVPDFRVLELLPATPQKRGRLTVEMICLGAGTGWPDQKLRLPAPVARESLRLFTHEDQQWQPWILRDDLDASQRTDFHVSVDFTSGLVGCGDGERGRIWPTSSLVLATGLLTRAGAGNMPAKTVMAPVASPQNPWLAALPPASAAQLPLITRQLYRAEGGTAAETVAEAGRRAVAPLYAHEQLIDLASTEKASTLDEIPRATVAATPSPIRASTTLDIERLALDVPGTHVARARAWDGVDPARPCDRTPGVVTVVVIPDLEVPRPEPSAGLLSAVKSYLGRRRIICTRIEVVGPRYLEVNVEARIRVEAWTSVERIRAALRQAVDAFLDPLTGGPGGTGWPFGRDVYRSEVLQVLRNVAGVEAIEELRLRAGSGEPGCGNVSVCRTSLVVSGRHQFAFEGKGR